VTLRLRLLLVLVGLVAAGLVAADIVTYNSLGSFLFTRIDQQLADATDPVAQALDRCAAIQSIGSGPLGSGPLPCQQYIHPGPGQALPAGTFGELRAADGSVVVATSILEDAGRPVLPAALPGSGSASTAVTYFSAPATGGAHTHFQVMAQPVNGGTLVVAFPITDIEQTLRRLRWIEGLVTGGVLLALGVAAWWIVRRGLRPLDDMATTAGAIAAGDLSRRVPDDGGRTEVGRLGVALNTMLGNIEQAFAARAASEERLRRFLADASHELRTPLTSIRGYAEMFDRGARERPEDLATSMRNIRTEADRMSELVNDLLLLARLDRERPLEREDVDVAEVVGSAVDAARVTAPDRTFTVAPSASLVVEGDASRLRQVVDNLLTNAVRHTPAGTPVEVVLDADPGFVTVEVRDHGPGVPAEEQAHIFEPFHRADPSRARKTGGVGLGLAIVAAITRAHGGDVGVRSNGAGATFWVRLPRPAGRATPPGHQVAAPGVPVDEPA
jgi:two-component system OmpR family sensor kinase